MMEIENGYIKLYRSFLQWEWHDNEYMLTVFLHCLLLANWKDKKWHGTVVKRGSFITSYSNLAKTCGIARNTCINCLDKLQDTGELTVTTTNKFTMITVNNYDRFQVENGFDNHLDNHLDNHVESHPVNFKMVNNMYTTEEYKEVKKKEVIYIVRFLNEHTGSHYRVTNRTTHLIQSLFEEGFTTEDITTVILNKCAEWKGTEYEKYLRPATLFGNKFESYLNQKQTVSLPFGGSLPDWYTSEPVRNTEPEPATQEEIEATKELIMKGVTKEGK